MPCAAMAARTATQRRSSSAVEIGLISRSAKTDIVCSPGRATRVQTGAQTRSHTGRLRVARTDAGVAPKCAAARVCDISLQGTGARRNSLLFKRLAFAHSKEHL